MITVLPTGRGGWTFTTVLIQRTMTTIGKRYLDRTKSKDEQRILDTRTRSVISAVLTGKQGKAAS
jgi:hypothetical protein